jgi:hypothetical protein
MSRFATENRIGEAALAASSGRTERAAVTALATNKTKPTIT